MRLLLIVFTLGAVSLAGEIAMARLLAPIWGSGTVIWSFIIAAVLLALALGYWFGGKRADLYPEAKYLVLWLLPGAILLLLQPWFGKILLGPSFFLFFLFISLGSLAFFFLGAASPWALRLLDKDPEHSGALAGKLFAAGTMGSFLGTLLSALVLLPELGTGRTFFLLGGLALLALSLLDRRVLLLLPIAITLFFTWGSSSSQGTLWEGESAEQHLRVRETPEGLRLLELDDGRDVQSIYRPGKLFSGDLWDAPLYLWAAGESRKPGKLLVLGNGAGTTLSAWNKLYREKGVGIELDAKITDLAYRYFGLKRNSRVLHGDARWRMRGLRESFSTIFLDTYDANHIPFHLLTEEFFLELKDRLRKNGILLINIQPRGTDIAEVIGRTSRAAFRYGKLWRWSEGNHFLLLGSSPIRGENILRRLSSIPPELQEEARRAGEEISSLRRNGELWTDDRAPAERYGGG